jgi:thiol-disulfide isomerase/thioredoxin
MILLLGLIASLQFSPDSTNQLLGAWLNQNPSTPGITQIVITRDADVFRVHAWGACVPLDCDWGVTELTLKEGIATAIFDAGPMTTTTYFVLLPNDKLLAVHKSELRDNREYHDQDHLELFEREKVDQNQTARELLKKVGATYSSLTSAEFQFEEIHQFTDEATATREKVHTRVLISSPGKWRKETTGIGERTIEISDGKTFWAYFPGSNQYTVYPTGKQGNFPLDRYRSIDQVRGSTTIATSEHVGNVDCTVIKIKRPDSVRTLWIDPKTNFIVKDDSTTASSTPPNLSTINWVITFSVARALPSADEQLFSFDPQTLQAKPREELKQQARTNSVGTHAPDFMSFDLKKQPVRLSGLKGKVVLLDFWATWCVPCRAALPTIELLHREFKDKGLVVLGVDDEDSEVQTTFLDKFGFTFGSLLDPTEEVKNLYSVAGFPTTVLIDKQGTIQMYELGGSSYSSLRETLRKMGLF